MSVMHRVDQDVTRRGRRARRTIGLTVAAGVVVVGLGGYGLVSVDDRPSGGVSAASDGASSDSAGSSARAEKTQGEVAAAPDSPGSPVDEADRQVITTGRVSVTVTDPRAAAGRISGWVESIGGRVDARTETGFGDDASATLTVRVPSTQVGATIERLGDYGTVDDVAVQKNDVTAQTTDLDARIDALRLSIDRLETILAVAGSSTEVIRAEDALTQRQEQLESLQAQRAQLADQVSLSTLTIDLTPEAATRSVEPGGFAGGLRDGWNALVSTVNAVVEVAGVVLPFALVAAVVVGVPALIGRRRRTRSRR